MRAVVLTSNSNRHAYFAETIANAYQLVGVIRESKGEYYSSAEEKSPLIERHFEYLSKAEQRYFASARWPDTTILDLKKGKINEGSIISRVVEMEPDVIFLFGTSILNDKWLELYKDNILNLHLGLSPYYRGSATLFWPTVNKELECVGATIHLAEKMVDAGRILKRVKPMLSAGDSYYDISYKTIKQSIEVMPVVALSYLNGEIDPQMQDLSAGLVYKKNDFNENALRTVLDFLSGGLTKQQLEIVARSDKCSCLS